MIMSRRPKRVRMPSATSIVARSYPDHVIGIENKLPWHLGTDLRHFKTKTEGHAVIMGKRTYESLPRRPLPKRLNVVLSREPFQESDNLRWARDITTALLIADTHTICNMQNEFFVIGGETIYLQFEKIINKVWLTEVFAGRMNGDARFDYVFEGEEWWSRSETDFPASEQDEFPFRITCHVRRKPIHRQRAVDEFHFGSEITEELLDAWLDQTSSGDQIDVNGQMNLL
jgi:dihydrofolate reductase